MAAAAAAKRADEDSDDSDKEDEDEDEVTAAEEESLGTASRSDRLIVRNGRGEWADEDGNKKRTVVPVHARQHHVVGVPLGQGLGRLEGLKLKGRQAEDLCSRWQWLR